MSKNWASLQTTSRGQPCASGPSPVRFLRFVLGAGALAAAAAVLWFALGMNRGLLLSNDIKSRCWPWAPTYPIRSISAPALSDPVWQFVPWLEFARQELRAGRLPLWNPHQDGGVPLLANMSSALGSPLVFSVLLFGTSDGWNPSLLLRLLVALTGAYVWLRDCGRSTVAAALGAVGFALSGPFIAWLEHPHTLTAAPIPWVLVFVRRLTERSSRWNLPGLALATYLVLSGGHPETQVMAALLAGGLLLVHMRRAAQVPAALGGALLGAGLASPFLLPFLEYFRLSQAHLGIGRHSFVLPPRDLLRFLVPRLPGSNVIEAAATVSVTLLLLVPIGLALTRSERETLFWSLCAVSILAVTYDNPIARFLALHTPIYWTRALLLLPLALGYLASAGLDAVRARSRVCVWAPALAPLLFVATATELLMAAQGVHGRTSPAHLAPMTPLLDTLRADPGVFRILPLHTFLPPNTATDYGLDDVRGYDALAPSGWRERRQAIGQFVPLPTQADAIEPWELVAAGEALDFWNVKYLLLHPQFPLVRALREQRGLDVEEIYSGPDGRILRNRRALPRVRLAGPGTVRILERSSTAWALEVEARGADSLLLANPGFPGWIARIDDRRATLRGSPGEPMEVRVPAGRHRVEFLYRPVSFRMGLALAAACGLVLSLMTIRASLYRWRTIRVVAPRPSVGAETSR